MHEDSDDEEFVYPGAEQHTEQVEAEEEQPRRADPKPEPLPVAAAPVPTKSPPSPAQLEALHAAATSGELTRVQTVFKSALKSGDVESFALANDAPSRIGQTALHAASSRGYLDIVKWRTCLLTVLKNIILTVAAVVEDCGAIPDIEDREGEVRLFVMGPLTCVHIYSRRHCIKLPSMDIYMSSSTSYQTRQTCMHKMQMDGQRCTTHARRCVCNWCRGVQILNCYRDILIL